ncbi:MAG: hypothetical protein EPO16_09060 [Dehalococcoidia bacterium]|nr:MAG: hypothetical protein EPO16_09060 [Dehalococcoidia bacterium]
MIDADLRADLAARLEVARRALLGAMEGLTERDFATDLGEGETVVRLLANLAAAEHQAVGEAGGTSSQRGPAEKPLPPQVVHDLAGARYRILRCVDDDDADEAHVRTLVAEVERLEAAAVERIRDRPPAPPPPPSIPVIGR